MVPAGEYFLCSCFCLQRFCVGSRAKLDLRILPLELVFYFGSLSPSQPVVVFLSDGLMDSESLHFAIPESGKNHLTTADLGV
jgi:hypothetical protein